MLHFPLLSGKSRTLAADLGMGAAYTSTQAGSAVQLLLTIKSDGTWAFTVGAGDTLGGSPTSGTWGQAAMASATQVRITTSGVLGGGSINNSASSWQYLTSNQTLEILDASGDTSANVLIEIAEDGGGDFVNESISMAANGA